MRILAIIFLTLLHLPVHAGDVFERMGLRYGVDPNLLRAVAQRESQGHPWTVNLNGEPFYLSSKEEALTLIRTAQERPWLLASEINGDAVRFLFDSEQDARRFAAGRFGDGTFRIRKVNAKSFDVGLMQINWYWHSENVPSLDRLFDPDYNVAYGAWYLAMLIREHGLKEAVGRYHAGGDEARYEQYRSLVFSAWSDFRSVAP